MKAKFFIVQAPNLELFERFVQTRMNEGAELIGGPFPFAGMVCQAMIEKEEEHEHST